MNQVAINDPGALIESVIVKGDLERLSPEQRTQFYVRVCESVRLNPLTKPFEYIKLNGKLTLYAKKDATDQLRQIHNISVTDMTETTRDGVLIVTAKVQNGDGRTDISKGAVALGNATGDALANLIMKAETKAKRRATLSICGLGILDETELETIPDAKPARENPFFPKRKSSAQAKRDGDWDQFLHDLSECQTAVRVEALRREYHANIFPTWNKDWQEQADNLMNDKQAELTAADLKGTLEDSLEEAPAPYSKSDYIRDCHRAIDGFTAEAALLAWWNSPDEKAARRLNELTKEEVQDLMARVMERRQEILQANTDAVLA